MTSKQWLEKPGYGQYGVDILADLVLRELERDEYKRKARMLREAKHKLKTAIGAECARWAARQAMGVPQPTLVESLYPIIDGFDAALRETEDLKAELTAKWAEGSDGEWTCSGCDRNWYMEAETPEENEYLHCPGCGKRIVSYTKFGAEDLEETT